MYSTLDLNFKADSYREQLRDIGRILVRAGVLTQKQIRRQGVRFAIRDRFEAPVAEKARKTGER